MKRLTVLLAALALVIAGAAVALANDPEPTLISAQSGDEDDSGEDGNLDEDGSDGEESEKPPSLLADVLDELVDEDVITAEQADAILDRVAERKADFDFDFGFGHGKGFRHFRFHFPDDLELPEGFEFPELPEDFEFDFPHRFEFRFPGDFDPEDFDLEFRGPVEIPEEVLDQIRELLDSLEAEFDAEFPFGGHFFRFPGGTLGDFLEDGELSQEELDQIEAELRERIEAFEERIRDRFPADAEDASRSA